MRLARVATKMKMPFYLNLDTQTLKWKRIDRKGIVRSYNPSSAKNKEALFSDTPDDD